MRKLSLAALVMIASIFVVSGCSSPQEKGHRNLNWGMTRDEVIDAQASDEYWDYDGNPENPIVIVKLLGLGCNVDYEFENGGLYSVFYSINDASILHDSNLASDAYNSFVEILRLKYGETLPEEINTFYTTDPGLKALNQEDFTEEAIITKTIWVLENTNIAAFMIHKKRRHGTLLQVSINYKSKKPKWEAKSSDYKKF